MSRTALATTTAITAVWTTFTAGGTGGMHAAALAGRTRRVYELIRATSDRDCSGF